MGVEESLKGGFRGELFFGKSSKREIRESPEFKQCLVDESRLELLTPVCTTARLQAASMDKIRLTINTPEAWSDSYIMNLLDGVSKALLLGNIESEKVTLELGESPFLRLVLTVSPRPSQPRSGRQPGRFS